VIDFVLGLWTCYISAGCWVTYCIFDADDLDEESPQWQAVGILIMILLWPQWIYEATD